MSLFIHFLAGGKEEEVAGSGFSMVSKHYASSEVLFAMSYKFHYITFIQVKEQVLHEYVIIIL